MLRFSQPTRSSHKSYLPHVSEDSQGKEKHDAQLRANRLLVCVVCIFLFIGPALIWVLFRNPSLSPLAADNNRPKSPFTSEKFKAQAPVTVLPIIESSVTTFDSNSTPGAASGLSSAEWFREWSSLRTALTYLSEVISLNAATNAAQVAVGQASAAAASQPISWVAGKPAFNRLFTRDIAFSFLLMFPLSSTDTSTNKHFWDLSDLYSPSPKAFPFHPTYLPRSTPHPSVSASALSDMSRGRAALQLLADHQGVRRSERTGGEEPGKIPHELPGVDIDTKTKMQPGTSPWRNTMYSASDSTAMWILSVVHYIHMSNDMSLLQKLLPNIVRGVQYILSHVTQQGLFVEDPSKALNENSAAATPALLALKVSYWKDSALAARWRQYQGSPQYPVSYLILQAQNIAALRAVASLQKLVKHYASTAGPTSFFSEISEQLSRGIASAASQNPNQAGTALDLDKLIPFMVSATRTFFFHAPADDTVKYTWDYSPLFTSANFIVPPVNNPNTPLPSQLCPKFGFDSTGSLSKVLIGGDEMKTMITSDPLMALYFMEAGDLSAEEIQRFQTCFNSLETGIGYRTSNLPQLIQENPSPIFDLTRSGKELLYHHASVWGVEQAMIHSAALRFGLPTVVKQARKYFRALQIQRELMHQRKTQIATKASERYSSSDIIDDELVFPEFFLPTSMAVSARTGGADRITLIGRTTRSPGGDHAKVQQPVSEAEQWIGQGATVQLWSVAAWSYWMLHRAPPSAAASSLSSTNQDSLQSLCAVAHSRIQRGVSAANKFRYCPTTPTSASSSAENVYPALIFTCLDGSQSLWLDQVDDDYCDCADGSDEMGTAACSHSELDAPTTLPANFICANERGRHSPSVRRPRTIVFRSMVDDGVCDCCDGSDERDSGVQCNNVCV